MKYIKNQKNFKLHITQTRFFKPKNKAFYYHLNDLDMVWKKYFGVDHSNDFINNKNARGANSAKKRIKFDNKQMKIINKKFHLEYEYIKSKLIIGL